MDKDKVLDYLMKIEIFTIPEIQKKFSLSYKEVRNYISQLEEESKVILLEEIYFKYLVDNKDDLESSEKEASKNIRDYKAELLEQLKDISGEDDEIISDETLNILTDFEKNGYLSKIICKDPTIELDEIIDYICTDLIDCDLKYDLMDDLDFISEQDFFKMKNYLLRVKIGY